MQLVALYVSVSPLHAHTLSQTSVKLFSLLLSNCSWLQIISGFLVTDFFFSFFFFKKTFLFKGIVALFERKQIFFLSLFSTSGTPKHPRKKQASSLFPLAPFSGCRAGEPVPLAPALHHLRRLCAGGRPVVHTQRHQLAAPSDSLPLQCKSCPPPHPPK